MMICNDDFTLIMWLVELIQQLLSGVDPWSVLATMYELAVECGHTVQP